MVRRIPEQGMTDASDLLNPGWGEWRPMRSPTKESDEAEQRYWKHLDGSRDGALVIGLVLVVVLGLVLVCWVLSWMSLH